MPMVVVLTLLASYRMAMVTSLEQQVSTVSSTLSVLISNVPLNARVVT
jgi:hypothetical protein